METTNSKARSSYHPKLILQFKKKILKTKFMQDFYQASDDVLIVVDNIYQKPLDIFSSGKAIMKDLCSKIEEILLKKQAKKDFKTTQEQQLQTKSTLNFVCNLTVETVSKQEANELLSMIQTLSMNINSMTEEQVKSNYLKMKQYQKRLNCVIILCKEDKENLKNNMDSLIQKLEKRKNKFIPHEEKKEEFNKVNIENLDVIKKEEVIEILLMLRTLIVGLHQMTSPQIESALVNASKYQKRIENSYFEVATDKEKLSNLINLFKDQLLEYRYELQKKERNLLTWKKPITFQKPYILQGKVTRGIAN